MPNKKNYFNDKSIYEAVDVADDKVKGYGHLREEAERHVESKDPTGFARRATRGHPLDSYTNINRRIKVYDAEEGKFPMFAKGGGVTRFKDDHCGHADMKRGGSVKGKC